MDFLKDIKKFGKKFGKRVSDFDDKYEISEKVSDLKDKSLELNKKYKITKNIKKTTSNLIDKTEEVAENVSKKIEAKWENKITFDDFQKVELKVGKILEAEKVTNSKKLYKLRVDFDDERRTIVSGIAEYYKTDEIIGKTALFVTNLLPREIMGIESNGMILGLSNGDEFSILTPDKKGIKEGTQAG